MRVALGATGAQILGGVLSEVGRYLALGLILGLPIAWLVSRTFSALFFQVRATDLWVYALVAAVLALVGLLAAFIPARRASLIDPLVALRSE